MVGWPQPIHSLLNMAHVIRARDYPTTCLLSTVWKQHETRFCILIIELRPAYSQNIYVNDSWIDSWYCCIFILVSPCLNVSSLITFVARKKGDAEETVRLKPAPASTSLNIEGTSTLTVCLVFVLRLCFQNVWTGDWTTRINLEYSRDLSKTFQNPGGYGDELGLRTSYNLWGGHWVMLQVFEFHRLKLRGKNALEQSWGSELQGWWVDPWFSPCFWRLIFVGEIGGFEPLVHRRGSRDGLGVLTWDR